MPNTHPGAPHQDESLTAEQLAERQGVQSVGSVDDMQVDIWEDDAEVETFVADVRRSRRANIA